MRYKKDCKKSKLSCNRIKEKNMKIISCHIENFGKLSDFTMDFVSGKRNTICKENGWGKSTLAAFIKVMLYGFDNEGKRDDYENERKRFKPWQGGAYGGQLVFEADGKKYEASRIFGVKEKDDIFVLKDLESGLLSREYSERLGEDLFGLDSKSFSRSIFVSQDACETSVTDGISAKLGNLTDSTDDINNYEKSIIRLNDILNSMSPRRKTGEISKQKDHITELKQIISQGKNIEASLDNLIELSKNEKSCIEELKGERKVWSKRQQELSKYKDFEIKRKEYERISKDCLEKKEEYDRELKFFKNGIPDIKELNDKLEKAYVLSEKKSAIKIFELSGEEEEKLDSINLVIEDNRKNIERENKELLLLKENAEKENGKTEKINNASFEEKDIEKASDKNYGRLVITNIIYLIIGIGCMLLVLNLKRVNSLPVAIMAIGLLVIIVELFINIYNYINTKDKKKNVKKSSNKMISYISNDEKDKEAFEVKIKEKESKIKELERFQEQNVYIRDNLTEKKKNYNSGIKEYNEIFDEVKSFIIKCGFEPNEDMYRQLDVLEEKTRDIDELRKAYEKISKEKELFEINNDIRLIENTNDMASDYSLSEIDSNLRQIDQSMEEHNKNLAGYTRQIDELEEKLEYINECENELDNLSELYENNKQKYKILETTKELLEEARAAFTAKYTAPIKTGFDKYYNMITRDEDNSYKLDANINLSKKELGLDRETRFLSMGYKDLIGVCMRMALVDAMYEKEKPFIIFDDSFVNLDREKLLAGLDLLDKIAKEYQIIYFTCHESRV